MKTIFLAFAILAVSGCSVFGKSDVENAQYSVIRSFESNNQIEIRQYDSLVLVSTAMATTKGNGRNGAFGKLFGYISGENVDSADIKMTAPVFMGDAEDEQQGVEIPMTAPVFMDEADDRAMMSFVLPDSFTIKTAPVPTNPDVKLHELKDYTVAVITFSGLLSRSNTDKHQKILENWIDGQGYEVIGNVKTAGYNPPFTIPAMRRNEVLIPIQKPE